MLLERQELKLLCYICRNKQSASSTLNRTHSQRYSRDPHRDLNFQAGGTDDLNVEDSSNQYGFDTDVGMGNVYDSALGALGHHSSIPEGENLSLQDTEEYEVMMARGAANLGPAYKNVAHTSTLQAGEIYEQLH